MSLTQNELFFPQGKSEGFDSCDRPSNLTQIGYDFYHCSAYMALNLDGKIRKKKQYGASSMLHQDLFQSHQWISTVTVQERTNRVKICNFVVPVWPWWMALKNNRAPPLCHFKLNASFRSHRSIQTGVAIRKYPMQDSAICGPALPWNLTDDLEKQQGTSSMLFQSLYIIY